MKTLINLFLSELADRYDCERQLVPALHKIAKHATCKNLEHLISFHRKETEDHVEQLERVFESFGEEKNAKVCRATDALLKEADEIIDTFKDSPAINAALISVAQKIEHYEIASYGCLRAWAQLLGNKEAADLLASILEEEKAANESLIDLAIDCCNEEALGEEGADEESGRQATHHVQ